MNPILPAASPENPSSTDRQVTAIAFLACALCLGYAISINLGDYAPRALDWLTAGIILCVFGACIWRIRVLESAISTTFTLLLLAAVLIQASVLRIPKEHEPSMRLATQEVELGRLLLMVLGCLQAFNLRGLRWPLLSVMLIAFFLITCVPFNYLADDLKIDVFNFQQEGAAALLHGHNPYTLRYASPYEIDTPFYGPGVVDSTNHLTYGFPYFPLSLLLVLPAYVIAGDVRYAMAAALTISGALLCLARPGKRGALTAAVFMLIPQTYYVVDLSWTEPLLLLTFSFTMFCACRWRKGLPIALGLYFATKQYAILSLPAVFLLVDQGPQFWRRFAMLVIEAGLVGAAVTLPFFLWNPREFFRAVVAWQLVQPFRMDALSYLSWWVRKFHPRAYDPNKLAVPTWAPPLIAPLVAVAPAIAVSLWRCARSPAGFAAAVTLINITFFAFNKQAFCNYYYFVVGTACWTIAATALPRKIPAIVPVHAGPGLGPAALAS